MTDKEAVEFRRMLNCPMCGATNTSWSRVKNKMICGKCGYEFDRPSFRELERKRIKENSK